jgi:hypothetical protein
MEVFDIGRLSLYRDLCRFPRNCHVEHSTNLLTNPFWEDELDRFNRITPSRTIPGTTFKQPDDTVKQPDTDADADADANTFFGAFVCSPKFLSLPPSSYSLPSSPSSSTSPSRPTSPPVNSYPVPPSTHSVSSYPVSSHPTPSTTSSASLHKGHLLLPHHPLHCRRLPHPHFQQHLHLAILSRATQFRPRRQ